MRISDWSSDVCSSDLGEIVIGSGLAEQLGVYVGEPVSLMMVRFEPDGGIDTDFYSFRLAGIFHSDNAKYDSTRIVATMPAVQRMVGAGDEIGRASCRARVWQYVSLSVVAVSVNKKKLVYMKIYNSSQIHYISPN